MPNFRSNGFSACRRRFDPSSPLVLWQVGALGEPSVRPDMSGRPKRLQVLTAFLRRHYPARHQIVLYEASEFSRVPACRAPDPAFAAA